MAKLTNIAFLSKWLAIFADNTDREISEEDMRDFRQDVSDSFLNIDTNFRDLLLVDVSGSSFTIAFGDFSVGAVVIHRIHTGSANIGANKSVAFSGEAAGNKFDFVFTMTAGFYLQFPSNVFKNSFDGNWGASDHKWTCPETGRYRMHGTFDGTNWDIDIYGPRN